MTDTRARINAIGCAVPALDMHGPFIRWATGQLDDPRERQLFQRMGERSGIEHRWCALPPTAEGGSPVDPGGFYAGALPATSMGMRYYAKHAPLLAMGGSEERPGGRTSVHTRSSRWATYPEKEQEK